MVKQRLVFRLMVGITPDNEETKDKRLSELVHHRDFDSRYFMGVEPDGDYRLGEVVDGMVSMATEVISERAINDHQDKPKVMFMEFTVLDGGMTMGLT